MLDLQYIRMVNVADIVPMDRSPESKITNPDLDSQHFVELQILIQNTG